MLVMTGHAMSRNFQIYGQNCDILCNQRAHRTTLLSLQNNSTSWACIRLNNNSWFFD